MLRFYYTIFINLYRIPYYILKLSYLSRHATPDNIQKRYALTRKIARIVQRTGRIKTISFGQELLPENGGYVMYPNHQGRYDMPGIVSEHPKPCSFIMAEERSHKPLTTQICNILDAKRMKRDDLRQSVQIIFEVANEVKEGKRYVIFPEGSYEHEHTNNQMGEFKPGCFKAAMNAKAPIIPVALVDSFKPYEFNSLKKVITETHFLEPIFYEEYKDLNTREVADLVKQRIQNALDSILSQRA